MLGNNAGSNIPYHEPTNDSVDLTYFGKEEESQSQ
jgi:hypothetical protein